MKNFKDNNNNNNNNNNNYSNKNDSLKDEKPKIIEIFKEKISPKIKDDKKNKNIVPKKEEKLYVIPLGGLEEVGKNMTLIQYRDEIIVIDAGLAFPDDELLGIDLVIPDFTYLEKNKDKIKSIILTHGHEDHIGGLPYLYNKIHRETPLYGGRLTLALAEAKFEKKNSFDGIPKIEIKGRDKFNIGKYFKVEFISTTHSIADAYSIAITTPIGVILHTGDFKIDLTPVDGEGVDFFKFSEYGEKGVLLMLSDSTNSEVEGFTKSESRVGEALKDEFESAKGRIVIAAFASHVHRLQQIVEVSKKLNRKIAIDGKSMVKVFDIASRLGYLNFEKEMIIQLKDVDNYRDDEIVILCTGTQGEPLAVLSRIAKGMHKYIEIKEGDTVIISATPIPGNEKAVHNNISKLLKNDAEVIYEKVSGIHVSGHGSQDELKLMLNMIKPKFFMPLHGEFKHLKKHKDLAISCGIDKENIIIANNGAKIELMKSSIKVAGKVPSGEVLIDGIGVGDVGNIVLRDRQNLAKDGIVIVVMTMSSKIGEMVAGPDIITRGFIYARESEALIKETTEIIKQELKKHEENNITEWSVIKNTVREVAGNYFYEKTKRSPVILPIIMEI
ncbi:MAG: ribonuclease J [Fusobacteria bacterium]|nr:ribonuclease J [Fusobacteriota bacterium]